MVWGWGWNWASFIITVDIWFFPHHVLKRVSFLLWISLASFLKNQLTINMRLYLFSTMSLSWYFKIVLKLGFVNPSTLLFMSILAIPGPLIFPMNFGASLSISPKIILLWLCRIYWSICGEFTSQHYRIFQFVSMV